MNAVYFFYKKDNAKLNTQDLFHTNEIICVKQGFNINAFIFSIFWVIYKKFWTTFFIISFISIMTFALQMYIKELIIFNIFSFILSLFLAITAKDLTHSELKIKKYTLISIINAKNEYKAKLIFLKENLSTINHTLKQLKA